MSMESKHIWLNGKIIDFEQAKVHFLTPSMHYGVGVFEGIRAYSTNDGPAVFRLAEHMQRFIESAQILGVLDLEYGLDELVDAVKTVVSMNGFNECYIRPLVYFSGNNLGLNLDGYETNVGIAAWKWGNYLGKDARQQGIRACVSSFTRLHPNASMTKAKIAGNYANSILAKTDASRLGFDEAIMLDPEGYIAECSGENIFLVKNGKIITPTIASTLDGITRSTLLTLAADNNIPVIETKVSRDQLYAADEVFLCGTAAEVIAIREIDFRKILVDFGPAQQPFYIGRGSVAVPGVVAGLCSMASDLGVLPLTQILAPAIRLAREGVVLTDALGYVSEILAPILMDTPEIKAIYAPNGHIATAGDRLYFPDLAGTLEQLGREGRALFYTGEIGRQILAAIQSPAS